MTASAQAYRVFPTPFGPCAVAWTSEGLAGIAAFEPDAATTRATIRRHFPEAKPAFPPPAVRIAMRQIRDHLAGGAQSFDAIALDMAATSAFDRRVYAEARRIAPGSTATYGALAVALGDPALAREVGQALGRNPFPVVVPCHRVLAAGGKPGGFSARGGVASKLRLLNVERARTDPAPLLFGELPLAARA